jgi:hypothetical protein
MPVLFTNNASAALAASISASATTIVLAAGQGVEFPSPAGGNYFYATLTDPSNNLEIVKVTARVNDSLTVVRGQDGSTAKTYSAGDLLELRPVAAAFADMQAEAARVALDNTFTGNNTFSGTNAFTGANSFTNPITGSISGNAGTVTDGVYTVGDQTIDGVKQFAKQIRSDSSEGGSFVARFNGNSRAGIGTKSHILGGISSDQPILYTNSSLEVYQGSNLIATFASNGDFTAVGNVTANSDERLKSNIQTIANALDAVKALRGVSYIKDGQDNIGVIAQEVQKVFPQVVIEGADGYLSVAYGNLVSVLIEAVKELSEKVDQLEKGA